MLLATTNAPTPIKSTAVEVRDTCDLFRRDDGQTELDADAAAMPADMQPEQVTVAQPAGEQAGSGEDDDVTEEIVNAKPIWDDPALSMRAGLIVNRVRFLHETITC
jgi:hypothetical protein